MHRNPATLTTFFSSSTKHLLPSWLLGFQHEERETQFLLCRLFHLTPPRTVHHGDSTGLASLRLKNQIATSRLESQLTDPTNARVPRSPNWIRLGSVLNELLFSKITQNPQPIASEHDVIQIPVPLPIWGFYHDICDCHILPARACTPVLNVCPYPCTKPSSSKPN